MKFSSIFIFILFVLLGCTGKAEHIKKKDIDNKLHRKKIKNDTIKFTLDYKNVIKDYKTIDFESASYSFDKFANQITKLEYKSICNNYKNEIDYSNPLKSKDFFIITEYGLVSFNSIEDGDIHNVYEYLGFNNKIGKHIIFLQTLDFPITIFLDNNNYDYFYIKGEVFLSDDKNYFISLYVDVDYNIIGFYNIDTNGISNVSNLYSKNIFINRICIKSKIVVETILINDNRYYFELMIPDYYDLTK